MSKWTFKPNLKGFKELRNSAEMQAVLKEKAESIQSKAAASGGSYGSNVQAGATRAHARVYAADDKAKQDNLKNNILLKAIGGGS